MLSFIVELDVDFEAYCAECGNGICHNVETAKTKRRGMDCIQVTPCETCLKNAIEDERYDVEKEYEQKISELEDRIAELEKKAGER